MHPVNPSAIGKSNAETFLANVRPRKINRHSLSVGKREPAILERGLDPFAALLHRVVRQPHNIELVHVRGADIDLHLDDVRIDSVDRSAERFKEHDVKEATTPPRQA
jgi:hypothetical protein